MISHKTHKNLNHFLLRFCMSVLLVQWPIGAQALTPIMLDGHYVAAEGEGWKFTARLLITKKDNFLSTCTAVLVHKRVLLTAAHCLKEIAGITVFLGDDPNSLNKQSPTKGASYSTNELTYKTHPKYVGVKKPQPEGPAPKTQVGFASTYFGEVQTTQLAAGRDPFVDENGQFIFQSENYEFFREVYKKSFDEETHPMLSFEKSLPATRRADIALIVLKDEVPEPFSPITIWDQQPELALKFGDELYTFGYGFHTLSTSNHDEALRFSNLNLVGLIGEPGAAQQIVGFALDTRGPMRGDSGGPVAIKRDDQFFLVGLNSAAGYDGHAMAAVPQTFLPWIKQMVVVLSAGEVSL